MMNSLFTVNLDGKNGSSIQSGCLKYVVIGSVALLGYFILALLIYKFPFGVEVVISSGFFVFGLLIFVASFKNLSLSKVLKKLRRLDSSHTFVDGEVMALEGMIMKAEKSLINPISSKESIQFEYEVTHKQFRRDDTDTLTAYEGFERYPFIVNTQGGPRINVNGLVVIEDAGHVNKVHHKADTVDIYTRLFEYIKSKVPKEFKPDSQMAKDAVTIMKDALSGQDKVKLEKIPEKHTCFSYNLISDESKYLINYRSIEVGDTVVVIGSWNSNTNALTANPLTGIVTLLKGDFDKAFRTSREAFLRVFFLGAVFMLTPLVIMTVIFLASF